MFFLLNAATALGAAPDGSQSFFMLKGQGDRTLF
jgi:hypothetical protein